MATRTAGSAHITAARGKQRYHDTSDNNSISNTGHKILDYLDKKTADPFAPISATKTHKSAIAKALLNGEIGGGGDIKSIISAEIDALKILGLLEAQPLAKGTPKGGTASNYLITEAGKEKLKTLEAEAKNKEKITSSDLLPIQIAFLTCVNTTPNLSIETIAKRTTTVLSRDSLRRASAASDRLEELGLISRKKFRNFKILKITSDGIEVINNLDADYPEPNFIDPSVLEL